MLRFTLKSRKLGHDVTFSRPGKHYVFLDQTADQSRPGTMGAQICDGGGFHGNTIMFSGDDEARFAATCRRWWRQANRTRREY